jgi:hypothetical protein
MEIVALVPEMPIKIGLAGVGYVVHPTESLATALALPKTPVARETANRAAPACHHGEQKIGPSVCRGGAVVPSPGSHVLSAMRSMQHAPQRTPAGQKVNLKLGARQKAILCIVGEGIERGEIAWRLWALERRYHHGNLDIWMSERKRREYERKYRRAQPVICKSLRRLCRLGFVELVKHGAYVKEVRLTLEGTKAVQGLLAERREPDASLP